MNDMDFTANDETTAVQPKNLFLELGVMALDEHPPRAAEHRNWLLRSFYHNLFIGVTTLCM